MQSLHQIQDKPMYPATRKQCNKMLLDQLVKVMPQHRHSNIRKYIEKAAIVKKSEWFHTSKLKENMLDIKNNNSINVGEN